MSRWGIIGDGAMSTGGGTTPAGAAPLVQNGSSARVVMEYVAGVGWHYYFEGSIVQPADLSNVLGYNVYLHWIEGWNGTTPVYDSRYLIIESVKKSGSGGSTLQWRTAERWLLRPGWVQQVDVVVVSVNKDAVENSKATAPTFRCIVAAPGTDTGLITKPTARAVYGQIDGVWNQWFDGRTADPIDQSDFSGFNVRLKWDGEAEYLLSTMVGTGGQLFETDPHPIPANWTQGCRVYFVPLNAAGVEKVAAPYTGCEYIYIIVSSQDRAGAPDPDSTTTSVEPVYEQIGGEWYWYPRGNVATPENTQNYSGVQIYEHWIEGFDGETPIYDSRFIGVAKIPLGVNAWSWRNERQKLADPPWSQQVDFIFVPLDANGQEKEQAPYANCVTKRITVSGQTGGGVDGDRIIPGTTGGDNLITNPNFESGFRGWRGRKGTLGYDVDFELEPPPYPGFVAASAGGVGDSPCVTIGEDVNGQQIFQDGIIVRPGDTLQFGCWHKASSVNAVKAILLVRGWNEDHTEFVDYWRSDTAPERIAGPTSPVSFLDWTLTAARIDIPSTSVKNRLEIVMHVNAGPGEYWGFDNIYLKRLTPASGGVTYDGTGGVLLDTDTTDNVLRNPRFEFDKEGWLFTQAAAHSITAEGMSGKSLKIVPVPGFTDVIFAYQKVSCRAGDRWTFDAWLKSVGVGVNDGVSLFMQFIDGNGTGLDWNQSASLPSTGGVWTSIRKSVTAPAGAVSLQVFVGAQWPTVGTQNGYWLVDNAYLRREAQTNGQMLVDSDGKLQLATSTPDNLLFNPSFEYDFQAWTGAIAGYVAPLTVANGFAVQASGAYSGTKCAKLTGAYKQLHQGGFDTPFTIVRPGDEILVEAWVKSSGATNTCEVALFTPTVWINAVSVAAGAASNWYRLAFKYTVPNDASLTRLKVMVGTGATEAGSWLVDSVVLRRGLPVDVSDLVEYDTLGQLKIKQIPDSKITNIAATKILAGTLAAGVIYAGSISANQISTGTLSAITITSVQITASTITGSSVSLVSGTLSVTLNVMLDGGTVYAFEASDSSGYRTRIGPGFVSTYNLVYTDACVDLDVGLYPSGMFWYPYGEVKVYSHGIHVAGIEGNNGVGSGSRVYGKRLESTDSSWSGGHVIMGSYHLWIDASGRLRVKPSAPSSDTDGTVVGSQS